MTRLPPALGEDDEVEWTVTYGNGEPDRRYLGRDAERMARQHFTYARDNAPHMKAKLWRRTVTRTKWEVADQ